MTYLAKIRPDGYRAAATRQCPCCGAAMIGAAGLDEVRRVLSGIALRIVEILWDGRQLSIFDLACLIYGSRVDGGPDDASNVIRTTISRSRTALASLGWAVHATRGPSSTYYLRRVETAGRR